jgi:hypothetical protein
MCSASRSRSTSWPAGIHSGDAACPPGRERRRQGRPHRDDRFNRRAARGSDARPVPRGEVWSAGLTDSLHAELAPFGVRVVLIEPGSIATPIWRRGGAAAEELLKSLPPEAARYAGQIEAAQANAAKTAARGIPPERAARFIVKALTDPHPRPRQVIGRDAEVAAALVRLLPYRLLYCALAGRRAAS